MREVYDLSFSYDRDHPVNDHSSGRKFKMKFRIQLGNLEQTDPRNGNENGKYRRIGLFQSIIGRKTHLK